MQKVEVQRRFAATPERVWEVYTDHAGWSRWAGFQRSWLQRVGPEVRDGVGAVRGFSSYGLGVLEEVLEFEPPRRMSYRVVQGGLPMRDHLGEVELEPEAAGTKLVWRCRFESRVPGLGAPMRWMVSGVFRRALAGLDRFLAEG